MDSLLANYASSDDDEEQTPRNPSLGTTPSSSSSSSALFSTLPPLKPASLFSFLPQPNQKTPPVASSLTLNPTPKHQRRVAEVEEEAEGARNSKPSFSSSSSPLFSVLPIPKAQVPAQPISDLIPLDRNPKRVVQFKPPAAPKPSDFDDDDEEEEEKERKRRRASDSAATQAPSVRSFLSSIPAPRNSALGAAPLGSGLGRRSILEDTGPVLEDKGPGSELGSEAHAGYQQQQQQVQPGFDGNGGESYVDYGSYGNLGSEESGIGDASNAGGFSGYGNYGYGGYEQHGGVWGDGSMAALHGTADPLGRSVVVSGKRGRKDVPAEIVEVKQEDLTKDRPRVDQVKLTGIAFGPGYQPESSKGKPSKLHKRKHQIGSLYFDMKQKEMELAERRSRGLLTKSQTQGKYGW